MNNSPWLHLIWIQKALSWRKMTREPTSNLLPYSNKIYSSPIGQIKLNLMLYRKLSRISRLKIMVVLETQRWRQIEEVHNVESKALVYSWRRLMTKVWTHRVESIVGHHRNLVRIQKTVLKPLHIKIMALKSLEYQPRSSENQCNDKFNRTIKKILAKTRQTRILCP